MHITACASGHLSELLISIRPWEVANEKTGPADRGAPLGSFAFVLVSFDRHGFLPRLALLHGA